MSDIELPVRRWTRGRPLEPFRDRIAVERSLEIVVAALRRAQDGGPELVEGAAGVPIATIQCLPKDLKDLAVGFLLAEALVDDPGAIVRVSVSERGPADGDSPERAAFTAEVELADADPDELASRARGMSLASGCGKALFAPQIRRLVGERMTGGEGAPPRAFSAEEVVAAVRDLEKRGELFRATGCVHAAAAWRARDGDAGAEPLDCMECIAFREDIGRHNAVDKVAGAAARALRSADGPSPRRSGFGRAGGKSGSIGGCLVVSTGRLSADIAAKCVRLGAWGLASRSAATDRAIQIAAELGLFLAGFVRGNRMNVYCGAERLRT